MLAEKTQVFASKGEARRMIQSNAVSINKEKNSEDFKISEDDLVNGKYILAQKGKKITFYLLFLNLFQSLFHLFVFLATKHDVCVIL